MIKVIEHGKTKFTTICLKCGCVFEYELEDLHVGAPDYVFCPECNEKCSHTLQNIVNENAPIHAAIKEEEWRKFFVDYNNPLVTYLSDNSWGKPYVYVGSKT